jgi:hypothetical protein
VNLCEYVLDGDISEVKPESNTCPALGVLGAPDVTVWMVLSSLVQTTVLPTFIFTWLGENALSPKVVAPFTIEI